jgi:small subunit ribosomal protein S2|tara:strand:- start:3311 stop:3979 length:669 start_codon:yes stop_codon:yes gene_type:complete
LSEKVEEKTVEMEYQPIQPQPTFEITEKALLSTGIRVGTQVKTKSMAQFIQKTRSDGLHVIDVGKTLSRIEVAGKFLARFDMANVVAYSAREYAKTPVQKFCMITGAVPFTGRFMPGTFTNPIYPKHIDPEALLVTDPSMDDQAVNEASKVGIPVLSFCDTDNVTSNVDLVIPVNNRGRKALAAAFWLLARSILIHSALLKANQPMKYSIEDFETKTLEDIE